MKNEPKILTSNVKVGDIYYFQLLDKYYFLQVIKSVEDLSVSTMQKYQYYVIVFDKSYKRLPENQEEVDLQRIYQVKHKPKNTLLFVILSYALPELKILWSDGAYKEREKYSLTYWGNQTVSDKLYPSIIVEDISWTTDNNGVLISPSCAHIGFIFGRVENDEKANLKKYQKIVPIYFKEWLSFVDNEMIVKTEKILYTFEQNCTNKMPENLLRTCVQKINKLDEKHNFITTIERENLYDKLMELSKKHEICEEKAIEIIEKNRDW